VWKVSALGRAGLPAILGPTCHDVDTAADLANLGDRLAAAAVSGEPCPCPRTADLLRMLRVASAARLAAAGAGVGQSSRDNYTMRRGKWGGAAVGAARGLTGALLVGVVVGVGLSLAVRNRA
jgi:hypothetical protein